MRKRLHNLLVFDHLVEIARLLGARIRKRAEHPIGARGDHTRGDQRKRSQQNHHKPRLPVNHKHEHQRAEDGHNPRKKLRKAEQQPVRKRVRVRNHAADDLAVGMGIQIPQRQAFDGFKRARAQIPHHAERHAVVENAHEPLQHGGAARNRASLRQYAQDRVKLHLPFSGDQVDGAADQNRHIQRGGNRKQRKQQREHKL